MARLTYTAALDAALTPLGFQREDNPNLGRERRWARIRGTVYEGINLQVISYAGTTANLFRKDLATEALLQEAIPWERPLEIIMFGTRIGQLIDGSDRWWREDPNGPRELAAALAVHAPAYFDGFKTLEQQADCYGRKGQSRWLELPFDIYLALTLFRMGEEQEACDCLAKPQRRRTANIWRKKVESVRQWLGCTDEGVV